MLCPQSGLSVDRPCLPSQTGLPEDRLCLHTQTGLPVDRACLPTQTLLPEGRPSVSPQTGLPRAGWCLPSGVGSADLQAGAALESPVEGRAPTVGSCLSVHLPIPVSMGTRAKVGKWVTAGCTHAGETQACDKVRETALGLMVAGRWIRRGAGMAAHSLSPCTPLL